jgi:hypothetical protein
VIQPDNLSVLVSPDYPSAQDGYWIDQKTYQAGWWPIGVKMAMNFVTFNQDYSYLAVGKRPLELFKRMRTL